MRRVSLLVAVFVLAVCARSTVHGQGSTPLTGPKGLDFETFRTKIQPIFLAQRGEHARCYACHSQGTPLRLQELSPGATEWNEDQSLKNFQAMQRVVVPGQPKLSRLILMPLAHEAGGTEFHPGGKHFMSFDDPEVQVIAAWIADVKR